MKMKNNNEKSMIIKIINNEIDIDYLLIEILSI